MDKLRVIILAAWICMAFYQLAIAADYGGSVPLLCVPVMGTECGNEGDCNRVTAQTMNIPQFIRVDFKKKMLSGIFESGEKKTTAIQNFLHVDDETILQGIAQGTEGGRGWSMAISGETGKMALTVAGDQFGLVVFGACTPLSGWLVEGKPK